MGYQDNDRHNVDTTDAVTMSVPICLLDADDNVAEQQARATQHFFPFFFLLLFLLLFVGCGIRSSQQPPHSTTTACCSTKSCTRLARARRTTIRVLHSFILHSSLYCTRHAVQCMSTANGDLVLLVLYQARQTVGLTRKSPTSEAVILVQNRSISLCTPLYFPMNTAVLPYTHGFICLQTQLCYPTNTAVSLCAVSFEILLVA